MIGLRSLFLMLAYAGGIGLIALQWQRPAAMPPDTGRGTPAALPEIAAPPDFSDAMATYDAIVERPLFLPGRRPPVESGPAPAPVTAAPTRAADLSGLRLSAVLRGPDTMTALLELPGGESRAVSPGARIDGWEVIEIHDDRLVLGYRGQRQTLELRDFSGLGEQRREAEARREALERRRLLTRRRAFNEPPAPDAPPRTTTRRAEAQQEID